MRTRGCERSDLNLTPRKTGSGSALHEKIYQPNKIFKLNNHNSGKKNIKVKINAHRFNKPGSTTLHFIIQIVIWIRRKPNLIKPVLKNVVCFRPIKCLRGILMIIYEIKAYQNYGNSCVFLKLTLSWMLTVSG